MVGCCFAMAGLGLRLIFDHWLQIPLAATSREENTRRDPAPQNNSVATLRGGKTPPRSYRRRWSEGTGVLRMAGRPDRNLSVRCAVSQSDRAICGKLGNGLSLR
jgi:hypothetical protein